MFKQEIIKEWTDCMVAKVRVTNTT